MHSEDQHGLQIIWRCMSKAPAVLLSPPLVSHLLVPLSPALLLSSLSTCPVPVHQLSLFNLCQPVSFPTRYNNQNHQFSLKEQVSVLLLILTVRPVYSILYSRLKSNNSSFLSIQARLMLHLPPRGGNCREKGRFFLPAILSLTGSVALMYLLRAIHQLPASLVLCYY